MSAISMTATTTAQPTAAANTATNPPVIDLAQWLAVMARWAPPAHILAVGAGPTELALALQHTQAQVLAVDFNEQLAASTGQGHNPHIPSHIPPSLAQRITRCHQLLASANGPQPLHHFNLAAESGLLPLAALSPFWPNLRAVRTETRPALTIDSLCEQQPTPHKPDWIWIDCHPAAHLLAGAPQSLAHAQLVLVRVSTQPGTAAANATATTNTAIGPSQLSALQAELNEKGFHLAGWQPERNPDWATALFVRDHATALAHTRKHLQGKLEAQAKAAAAAAAAAVTQLAEQAKAHQEALNAAKAELLAQLQAEQAARAKETADLAQKLQAQAKASAEAAEKAAVDAAAKADAKAAEAAKAAAEQATAKVTAQAAAATAAKLAERDKAHQEALNAAKADMLAQLQAEQAARAKETADLAQKLQAQAKASAEAAEKAAAMAEAKAAEAAKAAAEQATAKATAQAATVTAAQLSAQDKAHQEVLKAVQVQLQAEQAARAKETADLAQKLQAQAKASAEELAKASVEATKVSIKETEGRLRNDLTKGLTNAVKQVEAFLRIQNYLGAGDSLGDFHGWPISPDIGLFLLDRMREQHYDLIIEFGSGTSTALFARAVEVLAQQTPVSDETPAVTNQPRTVRTQIVSFEHDKVYFEKTAQMLKSRGLSSFVRLIHAPLADWRDGEQTYLYYDCQPTLAELNQQNINHQLRILLLVDGPPGATCPNARYPAVPFVFNALGRHHIDVVLDDSSRPEEKQVIELWKAFWKQRSFRFTESHTPSEKGIYFATPSR